MEKSGSSSTSTNNSKNEEGQSRAAVQACQQLADLCSDDKDGAKKNRKAVYQAGGHRAVLNSMKRHGGSILVQAEGLRALGNMSSNNPKIKTAIVRLDNDTGMDVILAAMIRFPGVVNSVQRNGAFLLKNLCKCKEPATRVVDHPDGIPFLVGAIKDVSRRSKDTDHNSDVLVGYLCCALANIGAHQEFNEQIVMAGGLVALAEAKSKFPNNEEVQKASRLAMKLLLVKL